MTSTNTSPQHPRGGRNILFVGLCGWADLVGFLSLCIIAVGLTTSVFLMNLGWVLLLAGWTLGWFVPADRGGDGLRAYRRRAFRDNRLLQAFLVLMALHVVALLWSSNWQFGLDDIRKKLPLLVVPMVILTTEQSDSRRPNMVLVCYIGAMLVASVVGLVRFFTIPDLPYRHIVPFVSHIRFSLNLCLAVVLLAYQLLCARRRPAESAARGLGARSCLLLLLILYFVFYLFFIQSYTGLVILFVLLPVLLVAFWRRCGNLLRWGLATFCLLVFVVSACGIGCCVRDYYTLCPLSAQPLATATVNGNPYRHACDGFVENGNYVNNYVCDVEMEREWAKLSAMPIDSVTSNGYAVRPTLLRYLNGLGCAKDSVGMSRLTAADVASIEKGVANPVYRKQLSLRRMVYVMLFEYENYRCYRTVRDFTMLQRFELWRNGWQVFKAHPLLGTGTGDVVDECHARLEADSSPLAGTTKHTHNQYLTFLITFGALGFLVLVFFFVRGVCHRRLCTRFGFLAVMCVVLVSLLTEDTLETLAGCMFVSFFVPLLSQDIRPHHQ